MLGGHRRKRLALSVKTMILPGVVSVTFRKLQPHEVIALAVEAGLAGIEWGGDVHVPHGNLAQAREIRRQTEDAGLRVLAYGSYFRCTPGDRFEPILETASALGAPLVRIWAGTTSSAAADKRTRQAIVDEVRHIVVLARQLNIVVAFEHHENTLTDTTESTLALLQAIPGARTLWQPPHQMSQQQQIESLHALLPWLENLHVFCWNQRERQPLHNGEQLWREVVQIVRAQSRDHAALIEFVANDDPQQFLRDTATLRQWLSDTANRTCTP